MFKKIKNFFLDLINYCDCPFDPEDNPFPQSCDKRIIFTEECEKCSWRQMEIRDTDSRIKPCPFCGGKGLRKTEHSCVDMQFDDDHDYFWVECKDCGARTKAVHIANARYRNTCKKELLEAEREADEKWNKRG